MEEQSDNHIRCKFCKCTVPQSEIEYRKSKGKSEPKYCDKVCRRKYKEDRKKEKESQSKVEADQEPQPQEQEQDSSQQRKSDIVDLGQQSQDRASQSGMDGRNVDSSSERLVKKKSKKKQKRDQQPKIVSPQDFRVLSYYEEEKGDHISVRQHKTLQINNQEPLSIAIIDEHKEDSELQENQNFMMPDQEPMEGVDSQQNFVSDFNIGDRIKVTYICKYCNNNCYLTQKHVKWFKERKLSLPVYCNTLCRDQYKVRRDDYLKVKAKDQVVVPKKDPAKKEQRERKKKELPAEVKAQRDKAQREREGIEREKEQKMKEEQKQIMIQKKKQMK